MVAKCEEQGVLSLSVGPQAIRFVTHLDVNRTQIERAAEIIHTLTESPIPKSA
jgi:4-aminobutyrate aminotransferase-like enzyme